MLSASLLAHKKTQKSKNKQTHTKKLGATVGTLLVWLGSLNNDEFMEYVLPSVSKTHGLHGLFHKYGNMFANQYNAVVLMSGHLFPMPLQLQNSFGKWALNLLSLQNNSNSNNNDINDISNDNKKDNNLQNHNQCMDDNNVICQTFKKLQCHTLHVIGNTDKWVLSEQSLKATALFENSYTMTHDGAHIVPTQNKYVSHISKFVQTHI